MGPPAANWRTLRPTQMEVSPRRNPRAQSLLRPLTSSFGIHCLILYKYSHPGFILIRSSKQGRPEGHHPGMPSAMGRRLIRSSFPAARHRQARPPSGRLSLVPIHPRGSHPCHPLLPVDDFNSLAPQTISPFSWACVAKRRGSSAYRLNSCLAG